MATTALVLGQPQLNSTNQTVLYVIGAPPQREPDQEYNQGHDQQ